MLTFSWRSGSGTAARHDDFMRFLMVGRVVLATSACMITQASLQSDLVVSATPSPAIICRRVSRAVPAQPPNQVLRSGVAWTQTGAIAQGDVFDR